MLAFLVEVLEKGMQQVQVPILNIIYCMLHYIDLSSPHAQPISTDLIRVISKYLDVSALFDIELETLCLISIPIYSSESVLEGCVENIETSCDKKFNTASGTARFTRRHVPPLLRQFQ